MSILWYRNLYVGEQAKGKTEKIRWKIRHRAGTLRVFLLTLPSNEKNSLDIINAAFLLQPYYKRRTIRVVGIALSYEEAVQVLRQIVENVYEETKELDIKAYFALEKEKWRV